MFNHALESTPYMDLESRHTNLILTSTFNRKFSNRFTNKTGFTYTAMFYDMNLAIAPYEAQLLETVSKGDGNTSLISAYNSSFCRNRVTVDSQRRYLRTIPDVE